jgi:hypothetical protein
MASGSNHFAEFDIRQVVSADVIVFGLVLCYLCDTELQDVYCIGIHSHYRTHLILTSYSDSFLSGALMSPRYSMVARRWAKVPCNTKRTSDLRSFTSTRYRHMPTSDEFINIQHTTLVILITKIAYCKFQVTWCCHR